MKRGAIKDLSHAAELIERCEPGSADTEAQLSEIAERLRQIADDLSAAAVRRVACLE